MCWRNWHLIGWAPHLHVGVLLDGQVEDLAWVVVEPFDDVIQGQPSITDGSEQQRQHGLQTWVPRRRTLAVLLFNRMRR